MKVAKVGSVIKRFDRAVLGTYARAPLVFVRGKGSWLTDAEGRRYLDFFPGFGAGALGHCHPAVVRAIRAQAGRLIHIPNTFYHPWQGDLAGELLRLAGFKGRVFFCNSGAEANEAAIKLARRYFQVVRGQPRTGIVTMWNSFHGRTYGALAATGQTQYQKGFAPLPGGFKRVKLNDVRAAVRAVDRKTCAVLIEPILGEGGIQMPSAQFMRALRAVTRKHGALLMFDEVQTGGGRTGSFFAFPQSGVTPDAITLAKPLAGGLPIGALIVKESFAAGLTPGSHATTFGGSPLVCAAALAAVRFAGSPRTLAIVRKRGRALRAGLELLQARYPGLIVEIRGRGLMLGLQLSCPGAGVVNRCREMRLLINCTHETVLRTMPAMTVSPGEIKLALTILDRALAAEVSGGDSFGKSKR